jgi:hypothetical protein
MTTDKPPEPVIPRTLVKAHEMLARIRPGRQAPLAQWLAYYQKSAALYAEIAEIDRGHCYGQARDESSVRSEVARRGRPVNGAGVGRTCGSGVTGCAVTAAACNKTPHDE